MEFHATDLQGVFRLSPTRLIDERGFFARTWCEEELQRHGLVSELRQCSVSWNEVRGTFRGMHFQRRPYGETKIVRCVRGAIYDVVLDLRPESPTYRKWQGFRISADDRDAIYIPEGCAHGFQTLCDDAEVLYQIADPYVPEAATGVRFDDPAWNIRLPLPPTRISPRDAAWPDFDADRIRPAA